MRDLIEKASEGGGSSARTIAYLCEEIPTLTLSRVEAFAHGAAEPTLAEARQICTALGASFDFLWRDNGAPFFVGEAYPPSIREYLPLFRESSVIEVLFVRGNRMPHTGYVVLRHSDYRFSVLPHRWHVSSENGNGGAKDLVELALLSENVHRSQSHGTVVRGLEVPEGIAERVLDGDLHPRSLSSAASKPSHWWDDIADVDHKRACAGQYSSSYDAEFFAAQEVIKWARRDAEKGGAG